ncbi:hypothetical protein A8B79_01835 [Balneola sp. EhC07]|uniref:hypothetical protein n=1 Tax=Balneola sp. EhC07 TaxID=1849360 RepID=UPI0007F425B8|nr:hypothetical protein [Balneola sp. EhC07]OAN62992.1 hypothetical protein A8B79_01835 [Balneola sp. EhC07]
MKKQPIDIKRNSGFSGEVGTKKDGAIIDMIPLKDKIIVIKEFSVYELVLADTIDPKRTNIDLPTNVQKLIIDQGAESEIVSRTLLISKRLFDPEFFEKDLNLEKALSLSVELLHELYFLKKEIEKFLTDEEKEIEKFKKKQASSSFTLPSITDVLTRTTTIFQKTDHLEQIMIELTLIFYPDYGLNKQSHFPKLLEIIEKRYGSEDEFTLFLSSTLEFMKLIRNLRNCLDHRLDFVSVNDFELNSDSIIYKPSIELEFKDTILQKVSLSIFLPEVEENIITIFEILILHLCAKNVSHPIMDYSIKEIPLEKRENKFIRYSYWLPIGNKGYFHQL